MPTQACRLSRAQQHEVISRAKCKEAEVGVAGEGEGDGGCSLFGPREVLCPVGTVTLGSPLPGFDPALPEECDLHRACLAPGS